MQSLCVAHVSSVHPQNDVRIYFRECLSLSRAGFKVCLLIHPEERHGPDEAGVDVIPWVRPHSRFVRMLISAPRITLAAALLRPNIVHFHDPELLPWMTLLSYLPVKIVYDVHENLHEGLAEKRWLPFRKLVAAIYRKIERICINRMAVVLAEASYVPHYASLKVPPTVVLNYPDLSLFEGYRSTRRCFKTPRLFYIGSISRERGLLEMLRLLQVLRETHPEATLDLVGALSDSDWQDPQAGNLLGTLSRDGALRSWGRLSVTEGYEISRRCNLGLCLLHPIKNYRESIPTKILEYMAVGLPVICSNIPLYQEIVEGNSVGIAVDLREDPLRWRNVLELFGDRENSDQLQAFSARGPEAVLAKYSWESQERALLDLYSSLSAALQRERC